MLDFVHGGEYVGSERKAYFYLTGEFGSVAALADESGMKVNPYSYSPRGVTFSTIVEKVTQPYGRQRLSGPHPSSTT